MDSTAQSNRTESSWGILSFFRLGAFGFGMTGFFMAMDTIVLPTLVLQVTEGAKNTLLGGLGLGGLLVAALVQPLTGWHSDRIRSRLGRRVPYMLWSTIFVCLGLAFLIAAPLAYLVMNRWLQDFAYRIEIGPGVFLQAGGSVLLMALLTISYHAIQAATTNPVSALRYE